MVKVEMGSVLQLPTCPVSSEVLRLPQSQCVDNAVRNDVDNTGFSHHQAECPK